MEIKGYSILKEIQRGPITTVSIANQTALDRVVLLKTLNSQWQKEKDLSERFRREAKIYARLKHPHIVSIYDFNEAGESFYLAMEFVDGYDLADFILKFSPLPIEIVTFILKQILKGLSYAHQQGILHRDIKPSNILVGKDGSVKITDFGIASIRDFPALTAQGSALGTPAYMSPEQAMGKKLNARSDLFSLGVVIYEMLSGVTIFHDSNVVSTIEKVLNLDPEPLQNIQPEIDPWLSELVSSLLQKKIGRRPESAEAILKIKPLKCLVFTADDLCSFIKSPTDFVHKEEQKVDIRKVYHKRKLKFKKLIYSLILILVVTGSYFIFRNHFTDELTSGQKSAFNNTIIDSIDGKIGDSLSTPLIQSGLQNSIVKSSEKTGQEALSKTRLKYPDKTIKNIIPKDGGIFIICRPWAKIYIDWQYRETTPLSQFIELHPGIHQLELKNPNYESYMTKITTKYLKVDTLTVELEPAVGFLDLQVSPWAVVIVDGNKRETTPLTKPITLTTGRHIIELKHPNFNSQIDTINIEPGKTIKRRVDFK